MHSLPCLIDALNAAVRQHGTRIQRREAADAARAEVSREQFCNKLGAVSDVKRPEAAGKQLTIALGQTLGCDAIDVVYLNRVALRISSAGELAALARRIRAGVVLGRADVVAHALPGARHLVGREEAGFVEHGGAPDGG